jgi:hemoglobin/transferrin/lactoferrin receptor protein
MVYWPADGKVRRVYHLLSMRMPMPTNAKKTRQRLVFFALVGIVSTISKPVSAQLPADSAVGDSAVREQASIDQIVVVAHKSERSIREIAANVTVVSRENINNNLATSMADVFRYSPGIDYEASGSRFGAEGINIRGIGGNRVAMLVDGVPLSDQFDVGSFSNATRDFVNAGLIQRVEVLHGPASALYGSAAIGGVVAVSTPDPADIAGLDRTGGDAMATWRGADQSTHGTAMIALGDNSMGLLLGGSIRSGHELESAAAPESVDLRDFERRSALVKFVTDDRFGRTWRIGVIHQDSEVSSDLNSVLGTGRFRTTSALEGADEYSLDLVNVAYEFGSPESWVDSGVLRAFYETTDISQATLDERGLAAIPTSIDRYFSFEQDIRGVELNLQKSVGGGRAAHKLGFGLEYRERETTEYRDGLATNMLDGTSTNVILGEVFPLRDFPISVSQEWGAYIEDTLTFGDWSFIGAIRADRFELSPKNDPMYVEDYPFATPVSLSDSDVSPKLGVIYRLNPETDIYLQYAHGFRAPPYEDANIGLELPVFNYRAIPNPDLKSESSDGFDVGIRWLGASSGLRLSAFRTHYTDFIESKVRLGADPVSGRILFQSQNLAKTVIEGIEAGGHIDFQGALESFSMDGSLYVARSDNRENGQPLNSVGPGQAVVGVTWRGSSSARRIRLQSTFTDSWNDRDETGGELFKPAGHGVFDLFYSQKLGKRTTFRAGLLNLTDSTYWNWSDVRGLAPDDPVIPYLAQPGRNVSVSIDFSWQ